MNKPPTAVERGAQIILSVYGDTVNDPEAVARTILNQASIPPKMLRRLVSAVREWDKNKTDDRYTGNKMADLIREVLERERMRHD